MVIFGTMRTILLLSLLALLACGNPIKNESDPVVVEPGTDTSESITPPPPPADVPQPTEENVLGYWVGDFVPQGNEDREYDSEYDLIWTGVNKINVSLNEIRGDSVFGHSVVANNHRPFRGTRSRDEADRWVYNVAEPGDDRYDGAFTFRIEDDQLTGTWQAYGKVETPKREYTLTPRAFSYDPNVQLEFVQPYVDWTNTRQQKIEYEDENGEIDYWMQEQFASAGNEIYEINASADRLTKADVENLKRGDLTIIRNTIYARHGYSFKKRPLRVFFDAQDWYVPVSADIRSEITKLEVDNINLLLAYEENAAEYYDSFGR